MRTLTDLSDTLSRASQKRFRNVFSDFSWPEQLDGDERFYTPELISLYGTAQYDALDYAARRKLGFYELINFFSLNIHGEKYLLAGMSDRLYRKYPAEISRYIHHFIDEENKHMSLFGNFCSRYHRVYPDKKFYTGDKAKNAYEDILFFSKVVVFEEIVDYYNLTLANDEKVHPLVRDINRYHHEDEVRHLAFGRKIVADLFAECRDDLSDGDLAFIEEHVYEYFLATMKEYCNPYAYRDTGIRATYEAYRAATASDAWRDRLALLSRQCLASFETAGVIRRDHDEIYQSLLSA
ncbi:MAG: diiron oxygenase [Alcanivoracaceae bacterium]|nr:diiron oxygenase [Alcanivoracaceae bacterium]